MAAANALDFPDSPDAGVETKKWVLPGWFRALQRRIGFRWYAVPGEVLDLVNLLGAQRTALAIVTHIAKGTASDQNSPEWLACSREDLRAATSCRPQQEPVTQKAITEALQLLKYNGVLESRKPGRDRTLEYRLNLEAIRKLRRIVDVPDSEVDSLREDGEDNDAAEPKPAGPRLAFTSIRFKPGQERRLELSRPDGTKVVLGDYINEAACPIPVRAALDEEGTPQVRFGQGVRNLSSNDGGNDSETGANASLDVPRGTSPVSSGVSGTNGENQANATLDVPAGTSRDPFRAAQLAALVQLYSEGRAGKPKWVGFQQKPDTNMVQRITIALGDSDAPPEYLVDQTHGRIKSKLKMGRRVQPGLFPNLVSDTVEGWSGMTEAQREPWLRRLEAAGTNPDAYAAVRLEGEPETSNSEWARLRRRLQEEITPQAYDNWLRHTAQAALKDGELVIRVESETAAQYIAMEFEPRVLEIAKQKSWNIRRLRYLPPEA